MRGLISSFIDPRGRCDRRGMLLAALLMLAIESITALGLWLSARGPDDPALMPIKAVVFYLAFVASSQRLHDLGLSAWRIAWAMSGVVAWAMALSVTAMIQLPPDSMRPGEHGFFLVFLGTALPLMVMLAWLHLKRGQSGPNQYGPAPGPLGFALPSSRASRPAGEAVATR
jgi:uncharacterized membrane protein YhaH (DUF805 family)